MIPGANLGAGGADGFAEYTESQRDAESCSVLSRVVAHQKGPAGGGGASGQCIARTVCTLMAAMRWTHPTRPL